ncbi:beta-lactamase-like protein [Geopyxis carbonaria]|nr:beta-lactamase-like protein [Geopyxis carbonaria]
MKVFAELLTEPTADTSGTAVLLHCDNKRYIIGQIGEGMQRTMQERSARAGKIGEIFLTGRTEWANTGGLIGLILTLGDRTAEEGAKGANDTINVHGGKNILHTIAATRSFVLRGQLKLKVDEIAEGAPPFEDDNVIVRALSITPERAGLGRKRSFDDTRESERIEALQRAVENMFWSAQRSVDNMPAAAGVEQADAPSVDESEAKKSRLQEEEEDKMLERETLASAPEIPARTRPPVVGGPMKRLPSSRPSPVAMSYVLRIHDHRGKFHPEKAIALGVEPGPDFRKLTDGHPVTTKAGTVVQPEQCMDETRKGTGIAVCELPDESYVAPFLAHKEWEATEEVQQRIGAFFWILGPGVHEDPRLQKFWARFPNSKHVLASHELCPNRISFHGAAKFTTRLNALDSKFFPILKSSSKPAEPLPKNTVLGQSGLVWDIEPKWGLVTKDVQQSFDPASAYEGIEPQFSEAVSSIHASLAATPSVPAFFPGSDVEVFTLGTGSAMPSRYRNVSATLVRIPDVGSLLLDAGESTLGQLTRLFSPDELSHHLRDIKALYISHLHADHHLGAVAVLRAQHELVDPSQKTYIVAPYRFLTWLNEYADVEAFGLSRLVFVPCEGLRRTSASVPPNRQGLLDELGAFEWETAPANHCQSSFTTAVTFRNGFKLAYSGDTRPTTAFVGIGKDATMLLHEATFDDELRAEALAKKHSTIGEAVQAGRDMNARTVVLTHFSQRYPKKPRLTKEDEGEASNVLYAFDCMRFKVGEIPRFGRLSKGLEQVYGDVAVDE